MILASNVEPEGDYCWKERSHVDFAWRYCARIGTKFLCMHVTDLELKYSTDKAIYKRIARRMCEVSDSQQVDPFDNWIFKFEGFTETGAALRREGWQIREQTNCVYLERRGTTLFGWDIDKRMCMANVYDITSPKSTTDNLTYEDIPKVLQKILELQEKHLASLPKKPKKLPDVEYEMVRLVS